MPVGRRLELAQDAEGERLQTTREQSVGRNGQLPLQIPVSGSWGGTRDQRGDVLACNRERTILGVPVVKRAHVGKQLFGVDAGVVKRQEAERRELSPNARCVAF